MANALSWLGTLTDVLGITDTQAGQRGYDTLKELADKSDAQLSSDMQPVYDMYQQASQGRDLNTVLNQYDSRMNNAYDAGSADNVQNYLNPMYGRAMRNAADQSLAGAGASLQSSAADAAVANAVGNQSTQMWNQAFQQALSDSQNNQNVANNQLKADSMPALNWAQLTADTASTRYNKNMDLANAGAATVGQSRGIFANLF